MVAAIAAAISKSIRIATAGVRLRYCSPLRLAEDAHLLELLFPGRIEIGTIGGEERDRALDLRLLDGRADLSDSYFRRFSELAGLLRSEFGDPAPTGISTARGPTTPGLWLCSVSSSSATWAAQQSAGLAFSPHFATHLSLEQQIAILDEYRSAYLPSPFAPRPRIALMCQGVCAESESQAKEEWQLRHSALAAADVPQPAFIGRPRDCCDQLFSLADAYRPDELAVHCAATSIERKVESYGLLAAAFLPSASERGHWPLPSHLVRMGSK